MRDNHPSTQTAEMARSRLWGGPRLGAELDGLPARYEVPPHVP